MIPIRILRRALLLPREDLVRGGLTLGLEVPEPGLVVEAMRRVAVGEPRVLLAQQDKAQELPPGWEELGEALVEAVEQVWQSSKHRLRRSKNHRHRRGQHRQ